MTTLPISSSSVPVAGGRVEFLVEEAGEGPVLVYLHPAGGLTWDPILLDLARSNRVIAPILPGSRPGEHDPGAIEDIGALADVYIEGLRALGLAGADVLGQSFGGLLAAEIAARDPELFYRVILEAPIGGWVDGEPIADVWHTELPDLPPLLFADPTGPAAQAFFTFPDDPEIVQQILAGIGQAFAASGRYVDLDHDQGLFSRLSSITSPVLLVWGEKDRLAPVSHAAEFARRIPNARLEIVPGSGHIVQVEKAEATRALIDDFRA